MNRPSSRQCVRITATGGTGAICVTEHGRREFTPAMKRLIELVARAAYEDMKASQETAGIVPQLLREQASP